jgi:hypothetical protein
VRTLCVFLGLAALLLPVEDWAARFSLVIGSSASDAISIAAGAAISVVADRELQAAPSAFTSPPWIVAAFGAAGALVFLGTYVPGLPACGRCSSSASREASVLLSVLDGLFLLCFLKLTAPISRPQLAVTPTADPGFEPLVRIFLGVMLFIGATFSLVPAGAALIEALSTQSLAPLTWDGVGSPG